MQSTRNFGDDGNVLYAVQCGSHWPHVAFELKLHLNVTEKLDFYFFIFWLYHV